MRTPAALSAALTWILCAQVASAQTPPSAAPEPDAPAATGVPSANAAVTPPETATATATAAAPAPPPAAPATAVPNGTASSTSAKAGATPALVVIPTEPDQPLLEPIPNARDTLSGHWSIGASAGAKWAFGSHSRALGPGLGLNLDLGVGLSRTVVLGVWGEFDSFSSAANCSGCSGKSFAGGPFLRYHLVQGTRFDPWGAIAVGVRSTNVDLGSSSNRYFGPDIVKLTLGGDWYPTSTFGFGPYVTFDVGTYDSNGRTGLGAGLRLLLDLPGK